MGALTWLFHSHQNLRTITFAKLPPSLDVFIFFIDAFIHLRANLQNITLFTLFWPMYLPTPMILRTISNLVSQFLFCYIAHIFLSHGYLSMLHKYILNRPQVHTLVSSHSPTIIAHHLKFLLLEGNLSRAASDPLFKFSPRSWFVFWNLI